MNTYEWIKKLRSTQMGVIPCKGRNPVPQKIMHSVMITPSISHISTHPLTLTFTFTRSLPLPPASWHAQLLHAEPLPHEEPALSGFTIILMLTPLTLPYPTSRSLPRLPAYHIWLHPHSRAHSYSCTHKHVHIEPRGHNHSDTLKLVRAPRSSCLPERSYHLDVGAGHVWLHSLLLQQLHHTGSGKR